MRALLVFVLALSAAPGESAERQPPWSRRVQTVLDAAKPLAQPRGGRLPLFLWPAMNPGELAEADAERLVEQLERRGVALISSWSPARRQESLARALTVARAQKKLGAPVCVNATACLNRFFNGDPRTAHIDDQGEPFWDTSFDVGSRSHTMGCPFTLQSRKDPIREQVEFFLRAYQKEGLGIDFIFADWEIDGPIEFNGAHAASKRCARCRKHFGDIDNFLEFQKTLRDIRSDLQRYVLAEPVLSRFPKAMVGNYGVYPHDGYRYWYDYYERYAEGQPYIADQKAKYRLWSNEFPRTGYTCAMPVVYTWYPTYSWYDFENPDYRWFYNMLLAASNAGRNTPRGVPVVSFIHWHTTAPPEDADPSVPQLSAEKYQELLWHMLLRGTDTFFLWCREPEDAEEARLAHEVYAAAQEYGEFLEGGTPVGFDVPKRPGPVVSGLLLGDRLLVRRTDFGPPSGEAAIRVRGRPIAVAPAPGRCRILPAPR